MMNSIKINYIALGVTLGAVLLVTVHLLYNKPKLTSQVDLKELLTVSIKLAERGGVQTADVKKLHKLNAESKGKTKEGAKEMKTDGDMQSHRAIMSGLHQAFPQLTSRIVSEEHDKQPEMEDLSPVSKSSPETVSLPSEVVAAEDVTVWIDPLDATQEYTEDLDQYVTVMICVAVKGQPIIGVIHRPIDTPTLKKETVWAWVDRGISKNMAATDKHAEPNESPNVIISRSHSGPAEEVVAKAFGQGKGKVTPAGGAGYKALEVIRGNADIYAHVTLIKKWDICAGNALLNAVGGEMKTLKDETINYDMSTPAANEHGLLASMSNLKYYMEKLAPVFPEPKV